MRDNYKFIVQKEYKTKKLLTFRDVLASGNLKDILNYIQEKNLHDISNINLEDIYWLLGDKKFYLNLRTILKEKKFFDLPIWSYSLLHKDIEGVIEFFNNSEV